VKSAMDILKAAGYDLIIVETAGIGQSDTQITEVADLNLYVMTPEFGAQTQLEKIDMLDFAELVAINKFDKRGAQDALRDVQKALQRNQMRFGEDLGNMPVYGTMASQFNDPGVNRLFRVLMERVAERSGAPLQPSGQWPEAESEKVYIIPPDRTRYLAEIAEESDRYKQWAKKQTEMARRLYQIQGTIEYLKNLKK